MAESPATTPDDTSRDEQGYRTTPDHQTTRWPPGVPYIVGNEACERFSFYGMNAILLLHLVSLYQATGALLEDAQTSGKQLTHLFKAGVYALPMIGALLADRFAGKYRTILYLSLVYCAGHAVLSIFEKSLLGMSMGLMLIAIGSGGIKPCVSANVGDQFGKNNWFRVRTIFQIFYFSINFGSFFATILIPRIKKHAGFWVNDWFPTWTEGMTKDDLEHLGTSIAFAIPGVLMFLATVIFWMGRKKFVHIPPRPGGKIGLLDALSSVSLFLSVGHLFITPKLDWHWSLLVLLSLAFLSIGLILFGRRQRLEPDNGFLAITLFAVGEYTGVKLFSRVALGGRDTLPAAPTAEGTPLGAADPEDVPLERSRFWGPASRVFGTKATEGPVAVFKIISVFFLVMVFWALFDQHSTTWVLQAKNMDRTHGDIGFTMPLVDWDVTFYSAGELDPQEIPALNPLMVMILIPLMNPLYRLFDRMGLKTTPLRRITAGMVITALSFVSIAIIQAEIDAQGIGEVHVVWQLIPFWLITIGEVMVSVTGLEFAYTQAPRRMKSTVMGFWLLTVSLGNVLVVLLTGWGMSDQRFFWVCAALMGAAGLLFGLRAYFYTSKDYTQE